MRPGRTVLIVGLIGLTIAACGTSATSSASPAPVASAPASSPPTSPGASQGAASGMAPTTRNLEGPGAWTTSQLRPALTFSLPDGWTSGQAIRTFDGADESANGLPLTNGVVTVTVSAPSDLMPSAPGEAGTVPLPADLPAWLAADKDLALGAPTDVTIGGVTGKQVEGQLSPTAAVDPTDGALRLTDYLILQPKDRFRLAVLPVGGKQVVVATIAPADRWDEEAAKAQPVLDSFTFVAS